METIEKTSVRILQSMGLKPGDKVFSSNNEKVKEKILGFIKRQNLKINAKKTNKEDLEALFASYVFLLVMRMQ